MRKGELQVGDWMLIGNRTYKVAAVTNRKVGYHVRKDRLMWIRFQFVDPLPATGDILTANGFTLCEGCTSAWEWSAERGYDHIRVSGVGTRRWPEQRMDVAKNSKGPGWGFYRALNEYDFVGVHRIQQVARLLHIGVRFDNIPERYEWQFDIEHKEDKK